MKLVFRDHNADLIQSLQDHYSKIPEFGEAWNFQAEFEVGDIFNLKDNDACFVSPANSMGAMDGGIDAYYAEKFPEVVTNLKTFIDGTDHGELLVGDAVYINVDPNANYNGMISAPTMRSPRLIVSTPENAFLATRAAVTCALNNNVNTLIIPGMGTGVGGLSAAQGAFAMLSGAHSSFKRWELIYVEHYKDKK